MADRHYGSRNNPVVFTGSKGPAEWPVEVFDSFVSSSGSGERNTPQKMEKQQWIFNPRNRETQEWKQSGPMDHETEDARSFNRHRKCKQNGRLAPAYFLPNYNYFELLRTVKNETTILNLVLNPSVLCFTKFPVAKKFMDKKGRGREGVSRLSVVILKIKNVGKVWVSKPYLPLRYSVVSSKSVSWGGGGGGGGLKTLCIKIGYSEPTLAEKGLHPEPRALVWRNVRFWLADDSCYVILDSDWLTKVMVFFRSRFWLADDSGDVILDFAESRGCCRDESAKIWSREPKAESMY